MQMRGRNLFKKSLEYGRVARADIEREVREGKKKLVKVNGPRAIFIEKYKENKNIEEGKNALVVAGFNLSTFNDEILEKWIEEERDNDGR